MDAGGAVGGWFEPGDDVGRAHDEAEAVLIASDRLDEVMAVIRDAESPVEVRRELKYRFGFTGRQAAVLLTLPVLSFTRSERDRLHARRRSRMELFADVTGRIPAIRDDRRAREPSPPSGLPGFLSPPPAFRPGPDMSEWNTDIDAALGEMRSVMAGFGAAGAGLTGADASAGPPAPAAPTPAPDTPAAPAAPTAPTTPTAPAARASAAPRGPGRRKRAREEAASVLDEQIGELCDAVANLLGVGPSFTAGADDPRDGRSPAGALLDGCGVDDTTGVRTLLWHLTRTGLLDVPGLWPFVDLLSARQAFEVQAAQFEECMSAGRLGSDPADGSAWVGRLWPIADRRGHGYAVFHRPGSGCGSVWAYGGGEPLQLLWDSVVDMLADLYRALTEPVPCDAALAAIVDGGVVWTDLG